MGTRYRSQVYLIIIVLQIYWFGKEIFYQDNLWNFLFFTGYLKVVDKKFKSDIIYLILKIPNKEIQNIYKNKVTEWFNIKIKTNDFQELITAA